MDHNKGMVISYISYFILIGFVCYITSSGYPLFALLLLGNDSEDENEDEFVKNVEKEN